jgi:hypothetical protein
LPDLLLVVGVDQESGARLVARITINDIAGIPQRVVARLTHDADVADNLALTGMPILYLDPLVDRLRAGESIVRWDMSPEQAV